MSKSVLKNLPESSGEVWTREAILQHNLKVSHYNNLVQQRRDLISEIKERGERTWDDDRRLRELNRKINWLM